jgi:hypothetical protein
LFIMTYHSCYLKLSVTSLDTVRWVGVRGSSIALYKSQSISVWISLSQCYHHVCKFRKKISRIKLTYR